MRDLVDELLHAQVKAKLFGATADAPQLGRLRLLERLGAGAMGTVFSAYDPRLDRKVAVKVLRSTGSASRVLAEARALAKLAHPNVVAVHDADELDGLVFIVMELAAGVPLRAWMGGGHARRDWRDVTRVLREAAAGIAAAHDAGLVHRDIKPDNILVGEDRARVVDFGLADAATQGDGASAGTPFYMAPEVLAGAGATAASDQFSLGVTMFEALYGKRPYDITASSSADTVPATAYGRARDDLHAELASAARGAAGAPRPPGTRVPTWVHDIVTRSLAADPAQRFPAMSALVDALGRDRRRRTRMAAIALTGIGVGALAGVLAMRGGSPGNPCGGGAARLAATWGDAERIRVRTSLANAPWSTQTLAGLDAHAAAWDLSYRRVCEATRVRGEQSDTLLDLRMRCLDRALSRMGALTEVLTSNAQPTSAQPTSAQPTSAQPTASSVAAALDPASRAAAPGAVAELPSPAACENLTSAKELALPTDPAQRSRAATVERDIDRAWASFAIGRYQLARPIVTQSEAALAGLTAPRLRAEVLALGAAIEARIGDPKVARARLDEAQLAAAEADAPELEYDIWARRMRNELFGGDPAKVIEWATFARAAAKRTGRDGAEIDGIVGEALRASGRLDASRPLLERALASKDALRPEQRAVIEMNLGSVQLAQGDSMSALATLGRARDRVLSALGDHHPDLAIYDDKLAAAHRARGKLRDALKLHDASLALRTQAFGPDDRSVATSLLHRAQTLIEAGELTRARDDIARALDIRTKVFGATSPRLGEVFAARGDAYAAGGDLAEATGAYERARELDPRLDLGARTAAVGAATSVDAKAPDAANSATTVDANVPHTVNSAPTIDAISPLAVGESPSVERVAALAIRTELLAKAGKLADATALAATLRARYHAGLDPALAAAVAAALLAAHDREGAAQLLASVVPTLGNEPTRTALRIFIALARSSTTQAPAAARGAIALYQAMPQLDRADHDAMWTISRQ